MSKKASAEATVRNIRRKTRRKYSAEEKIRIVLEGMRGDHTIAELCRRESISENLYYRWSKDFLEAGTRSEKPTASRSKLLGRRMSSSSSSLLNWR
jgi:transposase